MTTTRGMMWQFFSSPMMARDAPPLRIRSLKTPEKTLSSPHAMSMRFVITLSLQERAISFHHTSQGSRLVLAILVVLPVRLSCLDVFGDWTSETLQSSIADAWKVILTGEPDHIVIHPVVPAEWPKKTARAFWHFCAEVWRWQDDRECFGTVIHPARTGFFSSQCSGSLKWRPNLSLVTFENQGEQLHGELSFLTNLPEGSLDRLESLTEGYDSDKIFDPRFAILLSHCVTRHRHSDLRQGSRLKTSLKTLKMELCALCACDLKEMLKHCRFFPCQRSTPSCRTIQKGSYHSCCISLHRRDLLLLRWFKH